MTDLFACGDREKVDTTAAGLRRGDAINVAGQSALIEAVKPRPSGWVHLLFHGRSGGGLVVPGDRGVTAWRPA